MQVGDYVRTKDGLIRKIVEIYKLIYIDKDYISYEPEYHNSLMEEDVIKSSPNIIDLIKVGDYVNGSKVLEIKKGYISVEYSLISVNEIMIAKIYCEEDIKTIVTKEQFEEMEFKL